uniref:Uncharacterized protein n=1 Tax=Setaria digitata TaxID=48799 RepID=A0A915Q7L9_9BILA
MLPSNGHEENETNAYDVRDENNAIAKWVSVVLFSALLVYSIIGNLLLAIAFCSECKELYNEGFILVISQLIICCSLNLIPQAALVIPELLQERSKDKGNQSVNDQSFTH